MKRPLRTIATAALGLGMALFLCSTRQLQTVAHAQSDTVSSSFDGYIEVSVSITVDDDLDLTAWADEYCPDDEDPYIDGIDVELDLDQNGTLINGTSDDGTDDAYDDVGGTAQLGTAYEAFANAYVCDITDYDDECSSEGFTSIGSLEASLDTPYSEGPPEVDNVTPPYGYIPQSGQAVVISGQNLLNSDGSWPTVETDDLGPGITVEVENVNSDGSEVDVRVDIPASETPNLTSLNVETDQGSGGDDYETFKALTIAFNNQTSTSHPTQSVVIGPAHSNDIVDEPSQRCYSAVRVVLDG